MILTTHLLIRTSPWTKLKLNSNPIRLRHYKKKLSKNRVRWKHRARHRSCKQRVARTK